MAEFWFRKATTLAPGGKDIEAATLFQKVRVKRTYGPLTEDYAVNVEFTEYGRAVFATDIFEEGGYNLLSQIDICTLIFKIIQNIFWG